MFRILFICLHFVRFVLRRKKKVNNLSDQAFPIILKPLLQNKKTGIIVSKTQNGRTGNLLFQKLVLLHARLFYSLQSLHFRKAKTNCIVLKKQF